jgi:glycosyltransferase involved in cell wall biosynthesis
MISEKSKLTIAVVLPAYNEENTIVETISGFRKALPEASIWVINNRSSDDTERTAYEAIERLGCTGGVINESRPGKGNAIRRAFIEINADIYVLADADLTYPPAQAQLLIDPLIRGNADMVVGDRHSNGRYAAENKRPLNNLGNKLVRWLVNKLFGSKLMDIMSGYRALSKQFVKNYPILVDGFEIETDMTLHALDKRFRIIEIPVEYKDRPEGSVSKLSVPRDGFRVIKTIFNILRHYRPLLFFGSTGIIFIVLGLAAGIPVIDEWIEHQFIYRVPLAILATGLGIISIMLIAVGLILDLIAHQDKLNFERSLLKNSK